MSPFGQIGDALRELRGSRTQREVAKLTGLNPQRWSDYELNKRIPTLIVLGRILEGLELSVWDLAAALTGESRESAPRQDQEGMRDVLESLVRPIVEEHLARGLETAARSFVDSRLQREPPPTKEEEPNEGRTKVIGE